MSSTDISLNSYKSSGRYSSSSLEVTPPKDTEELSESPTEKFSSSKKWRNLVAFWFFGLCNNFAYVIMLSAAHDILDDEEGQISQNTTHNSTDDLDHFSFLASNHSNQTTNNETHSFLECNTISTGAILLADVLPTFIVKLTATFYIDRISYRVKISIVILFALGSFLIVALAQSVWLSIIGVACASVSAGLGEPTFLGLSTFYSRNVVSTWSSGTGGAGIFGALSYAGLTTAGVSPRNTLLIMTVVPVIMAVCYMFLLMKPDDVYGSKQKDKDTSESQESIKQFVTWKEKMQQIKPLLKFMIPLMIVYFAEYFINQGLHELLYFNDIWLKPKQQYRWYQVIYQLGVFISRSSVNLVKIEKLWILPILQVMNIVLLLTQVFYRYIPNIWIIFAIILFEGLLGGSAYVNTFYKMSKDIASEYREWCLSVATIADSTGIGIAGAVAIPIHNTICGLKIRM